MALPAVNLGDPHADAHNDERDLMNAIQNLSDTAFATALTNFIESQIESGAYVPLGSWDFAGATVTGLDIPATFSQLTDVDWSTPPTDGQTFVWDAATSKLIPTDVSTAFQQLTDVDWSTPPTDGQTFVWDTTTGKLIPTDVNDSTGTLLLESGQTAANVPAGTPVNTIVFEKGV